MNKLFNFIKWGIVLGAGSQNFLGSRWIQTLLDHTPKAKQRQRVLQLLTLSPHYFFNREAPEFSGMGNREYLEAAFTGGRTSRRKYVNQVLKEQIGADDIVLDYGCGPGFLASTMAPKVKHVYALDISPGALVCARILNPAKNIDYIIADKTGLDKIPNDSIDAVTSLAVIQHVTDEIYLEILRNCRQKLKPGGRLILHIQLLNDNWKTQEEWISDRSIRGRLKWRYGLHCFARPPESHLQMVKEIGFENVKIESLADLVTEHFDDVCSQHLLTATKPL